MKKRLLLVLIAVLAAVGIAIGTLLTGQSDVPKVGVLVPIEHQAMTAMVGGFQDELSQLMGESVRVEVANAQGDAHLQQAIIDKFRRGNYDIVIPIGTDVTRTVAHQIVGKPVLGLDVTKEVDEGSDNLSGVLEAELKPSVTFIRTLFPEVERVTILYHPTEKIDRQAKQFQQLMAEQGVAVQPLMVGGLPDLYTVSKAVTGDLLFILKDHLVASGVAAVAKVGADLQIPVVTSDEGSVRDGGGIALGNPEESIGRQGAQLAAKILSGETMVPLTPVNDYQVFLNPSALKSQGANPEQLQRAAKAAGYSVQIVAEQ